DSQLHASTRWLSGTWVLGNDYRGSGYYGAYPPAYLSRIETLFPDQRDVLHLFAGSLPRAASRHRVTVDLRRVPGVIPGVQADAPALPFLPASFDVCYCDPPYSAADAARYETPLPNRKAVLLELHRVIRPGGFLVWMDTVLPMYRKTMWQWCGAITLWR